MGESRLVSFPPPTKMLPFGGLPLPQGSTMVPKNHGEKSHSGILGSIAACAYPRLFRGLPRPSSVLKPSHPPDGVAYRAFGSVCVTSSVKLPWCWFNDLCMVSL
jgi:hypothetical protein